MKFPIAPVMSVSPRWPDPRPGTPSGWSGPVCCGGATRQAVAGATVG